jgi:hypothetical protein
MVTAKLLSFEKSTNGNILINVEYTLPDKKKVTNPYHAQYLNFAGKTAQEITDFVKAQIDFQCERYLEAYLKSSINDNVITELNSLKDSTYLKDKIVWLVTESGEIITEQLKTNEVIKEKLSIDDKGVISKETLSKE